MGAAIKRLRGVYKNQPAAMQLVALVDRLTRLRDLCAHGTVVLVDPVICASVRELSGALYLAVLLIETWTTDDCSVVEAVLTQHGTALQAQLVRLLDELQQSQSCAQPTPAVDAAPMPDSTGTSAIAQRLPFTQQQEQRIRSEMQAALIDPCGRRTLLVSLCYETTFSNNCQDRSDNEYPRRMLADFIAQCCTALRSRLQSAVLGRSVDELVALACMCVELATHWDMKDAAGDYAQVASVRDCIQQHIATIIVDSGNDVLTYPLTIEQLERRNPTHNPQTALVASLSVQLLVYRVQVHAQLGKNRRHATRLAAVDDVLVRLAPPLLSEAQDQLVATVASYRLLNNRAAPAQLSLFDVSGESELYRTCCRVLACPSVEAHLRDQMADALRLCLDDVLGDWSAQWEAGSSSATTHCEKIVTLIRQLRFLCWQFDFLSNVLPIANQRLEEAIRVTTSASYNQRQGFHGTTVNWQHPTSEMPGADSVSQLERVLLALLPGRQHFTAIQQHLQLSVMTLHSANPTGADSNTDMDMAKTFYGKYFLLSWSQVLMFVLGAKQCAGETKVPRPLLCDFLASCCADPVVSRCAVNWLQRALVHADFDRPDYMTAMHVLLPGLEWMVRLLLRSAAATGDDLPTMLRAWQASPMVLAAPDFLVDHLQLLLVDAHGMQLRGRVEHGLLSADHTDGQTINRWNLSFFSVLHAYLLCCLLLRDGPVAEVEQAPVLSMCHRAAIAAVDAMLLEQLREMMG